MTTIVLCRFTVEDLKANKLYVVRMNPLDQICNECGNSISKHSRNSDPVFPAIVDVTKICRLTLQELMQNKELTCLGYPRNDRTKQKVPGCIFCHHAIVDHPRALEPELQRLARLVESMEGRLRALEEPQPPPPPYPESASAPPKFV